MSVAVNLSARNLLDRDLPDEIARMLDAAGVPADALSLEITERMIMADPERAIANILRMSSLGMRLSVDDFGTGYFSLANLRRLPINDLKIDSSFVLPMLHSESDLIIVRSTINLGYDLGLRITAEGVEDGADARAPGVAGLRSRPGVPHRRPDGRQPAFERRGCRDSAAGGAAAGLDAPQNERLLAGTGRAGWIAGRRLQALRTVVADVVDGEPDLGQLGVASRQPGEDLAQAVGRRVEIEPVLLVAGGEDHRHPIVQRGDRRVRGGRQDRAGAQGSLLVGVPDRPQPGERERLVVVTGDVKRLLAGRRASAAIRRSRRR